MKKIILTSVLFAAILLPATAQQAEKASASGKNVPLEYLRPSLTVIYINRGEPLSERVIEEFAKRGIPGKFNANEIPLNVLTLDKDKKFTPEDLREFLEEDISRQVIKCWFPFDEEKGEFSSSVIAKRGMYNATDADVIAAGSSHMGKDVLETMGLDLINRSYILVYDIYNIKKILDKDKKEEGYQTDCDVHLYHIDWSEEVKNKFYDEYNNPNAIDSLTFPVRHIASFVEEGELVKLKISQSSEGTFLRLPDDRLFAKFVEQIEKIADVYLTKVNEDFKVKANLFAVDPLRAKVGTKEGVKIDQRYFVYEVQVNAAGENVTVRKGVMRATSKIAKNDTIATGDGPTTTFYQTYGKILRSGMLIQQQPDWGTGYSLLAGTDFQFLVELSAVMWLVKYIPALDDIKYPYGTKIFVKYTMPFAKMEINGYKFDNLSQGFLGFGVSKDFYFAHYFSATPYLSYQMMLVSESDKRELESYNKSTGGVEFGVNGSMAILHNAQIVGNIGWSILKSNWYATGLTAGVGARIQF
jgi:hypothetical protein